MLLIVRQKGNIKTVAEKLRKTKKKILSISIGCSSTNTDIPVTYMPQKTTSDRT